MSSILMFILFNVNANFELNESTLTKKAEIIKNFFQKMLQDN